MQWGHRELWAWGTAPVIAGCRLQEIPKPSPGVQQAWEGHSQWVKWGESSTRTHGPTRPGDSCLSLAEPPVSLHSPQRCLLVPGSVLLELCLSWRPQSAHLSCCAS